MKNKYKEFEYHGGPFDRGGADAFYGRPKNPHKYPNGSYNGDPVPLTDQKELEAYHAGYDTEDDRKDYR